MYVYQSSPFMGSQFSGRNHFFLRLVKCSRSLQKKKPGPGASAHAGPQKMLSFPEAPVDTRLGPDRPLPDTSRGPAYAPPRPRRGPSEAPPEPRRGPAEPLRGPAEAPFWPRFGPEMAPSCPSTTRLGENPNIHQNTKGDFYHARNGGLSTTVTFFFQVRSAF